MSFFCADEDTYCSAEKVECHHGLSPAFKRYADYLKAKYDNHLVATSDKWPPTPSKVYIKLALVRKNKLSEREYDAFTRLTLSGDTDRILNQKKQIEMDDALKAKDRDRLVIVQGAPGIGKSTFAWELCRNWHSLESLKRFELVILIKLREKKVQTATHITDLLDHSDSDLRRQVGEEINRREGEGVLFLFDGFDEFFSEHRQKSFVTDIIIGSNYLPKATVLMTSRPSVTADLESILKTKHLKRIEIVGFSDKEINEYAAIFFGSKVKTLNNFKKYLSANPLIKSMMYNPLNCIIVLEVYQSNHKREKPIPHTLTQLYTGLVLYLLSRHLAVEGHPLAKDLPDKIEDISDSNIVQQLHKLAKLSFEGIEEEKYIFEELPSGCSDLGLLNIHTEVYDRRNRTTYSFLHLTVQEFFSAFYISQLYSWNQKNIFLKKDKWSQHQYVVWQFVAGMTKMSTIDQWDWFEDRMMFEVNEDTVEVHSYILRCIYEAQDKQICNSVFGQPRVEYFDGCTGVSSAIDAYVVGYSIALCKRVWDVNLKSQNLNGMHELVEMLKYGLTSINRPDSGYIEKLDLSRTDFKTDGMKYFIELPIYQLRHIKTLKLQRCTLRKKVIEHLATTIKDHMPSLLHLDVSECDPCYDSDMVSLMSALSTHQNIRTLNLMSTGVHLIYGAITKQKDSIKHCVYHDLMNSDIDTVYLMLEESDADLQKAEMNMEKSIKTLANALPPNLAALGVSDNAAVNQLNEGMLKLIPALCKHKTIQNLTIYYRTLDKYKTKLLLELITKRSNKLKRLRVICANTDFNSAKHLMKVLLSPSSVQTLEVALYGLQRKQGLLDSVTRVSDSLIEINIIAYGSSTSSRQLEADKRVRDSTNLCRMLKENLSLKVLKLHIPLHNDEVLCIVHSLVDNNLLKRLELWKSHLYYFSPSEEKGLDPRIQFTPKSNLHDTTPIPNPPDNAFIAKQVYAYKRPLSEYVLTVVFVCFILIYFIHLYRKK